ncbi:MAG: molecular chaperone DnaK [Candidatus Heimdallarchaeota archaeon]|nr:molecular chaperone DnaK [Candidatus Heimdallarchaeota archaeon]
MGKEKVIGIDLGTTNSAVAIVESGDVKMIPTSEGGDLLPSVVKFNEDGTRTVGVLAKRQMISATDSCLAETKRDMGSSIKYKVNGKEYTPQEVAAFVLQKMKADAEAYVGETITKAVITVPAYFSDAQRKATRDAGKIAGLEVLRIVAEPTASALAYGLDKEEEQTILVFDLGGGTFDVSIIEIEEGLFEVKSTSGNNRLGGADFDERIVEWLRDEFKKSQGIDLSQDRTAMQRLKDSAEQAKIELSTNLKTNINIPYLTADASGPKHLNTDLTRAKFDELTADLVQEVIGPVRKAIEDFGKSISEIDRVLLVGGSTRIPAIQKAVFDITGKEPDKSIDPDKVVAMGAAIQAAILAGDITDVLLLDVTPLTLGIETLGNVSTPLIERNTTIPTRKSQIFSTAGDSQTSVEISVLQGERPMARDNIALGKFSLVGIPPAPRGTPQIEVTFDIDSNGIVNVSAKDMGTGQEQSIKITSQTSLSDAEIEQKVREAKEHEEEDKAVRDKIQVKNEAEAMVYQAKKAITDLGDKITDAEKTTFEGKISKLEDELKTENIDNIKAAKDDLEQEFHKFSEKLYQQEGGPEQQGAPGAESFADGFTPPGATPSQPESKSSDDFVDVDYEVSDSED